MQHGADSAKGRDGWTALMWACGSVAQVRHTSPTPLNSLLNCKEPFENLLKYPLNRPTILKNQYGLPTDRQEPVENRLKYH
jgi:hypothetical protein